MSSIRFRWSIAFVGGLASVVIQGLVMAQEPARVAPLPLPWQNLEVGGELGTRLDRNFDRLEEPLYQPDEAFPDLQKSNNWPGDKEGRLLLGLTLDAQAAHRPAKYLEEILRRYPLKMNARGYFGPVCPAGLVNEQYLAGHGWVLRGLCEYYLWRHDAHCLQWINHIVDNLVLPTKGLHSQYPIDPAERVAVGGVSGNIARRIGSWLVSTDVGCDFIFMDGVVQAYQVTGRKELKPIIEEMIARYRQVDLRAIKAQTHASLTGMRALLRYYEISRDPALLALVRERFDTYRRFGMTENYENYNWFGRPITTEPCAVVDSYMVAVNLWRWTGNPDYLNLAEHIYYNGLGFEQRANGGFGIQNCSGAGSPLIAVEYDEAWWCCTMRGGEGLPRVAQSLCFQVPDGLNLVHFNDATLSADFKSRGLLRLKEQTDYPFGNSVRWMVLTNTLDFAPALRLFAPRWSSQPRVLVNGQVAETEAQNGFVVLRRALQSGDEIEYTFTLHSGRVPVEGSASDPGFSKLYYGPLLLTCPPAHNPVLPDLPRITRESNDRFRVAGLPENFGTVYHLLDPKVSKASNYAVRLLFRSETATASGPAAADNKVSNN